MSKKRQNPKRQGPNGMWAMLLLGGLVTGALATYVQMRGRMEVPAAERRAERLPEHQKPSDSKPVKQQRSERTVEVIRPRAEGTEVKLDREQRTVQPTEDRYLVAINGFLENAAISPEKAKAIRATLKDGTLTVDFNQAFDRTYGSEDERVLVDGILRSLGQFAEVKQAVFTIEGEPIETLGHLDLTTPQSVLRD